MRRTLAMLAVTVLAASASAQFSRVRVETEHDEFTGETEHRIRVDDSGSDNALLITPMGDGAAFHVMTVSRDGWRFLRCHSFAMLIDDYRVLPDESDVHYDGRVGSGYVMESVAVRLTRDHLDRMARSSRVRFRICNTEFSLPSTLAGHVRELLRRVDGAPEPASTAPEGPPVASEPTDGPASDED